MPARAPRLSLVGTCVMSSGGRSSVALSVALQRLNGGCWCWDRRNSIRRHWSSCISSSSRANLIPPSARYQSLHPTPPHTPNKRIPKTENRKSKTGIRKPKTGNRIPKPVPLEAPVRRVDLQGFEASGCASTCRKIVVTSPSSPPSPPAPLPPLAPLALRLTWHRVEVGDPTATRTCRDLTVSVSVVGVRRRCPLPRLNPGYLTVLLD